MLTIVLLKVAYGVIKLHLDMKVFSSELCEAGRWDSSLDVGGHLFWDSIKT